MGYQVTLGKIHKGASGILAKFYFMIWLEVPGQKVGRPGAEVHKTGMDPGSVAAK